MRKYLSLLLGLALNGPALYSQVSPITINRSSPTRHGPEKGSLLIIGGNVGSTASIWNKFTELAGGKEKARVVVVTTAAGDSAATDQKDVDEGKTPELIGIGLDEATAILVQGDTLEVIGKSYVAIYDYTTITKNSDGPFFFLSEGQKYDLRNRKVIQAPRRRAPAEKD